MNRNEQILKALKLMFEIYKEEPSEMVMRVYLSVLEPYSVDNIKRAISRVVQECKFRPVPADLVQYLKPPIQDIEAHAMNECARVVKAIRTQNKDHCRGDKITEYLMATRWNINSLGMKPENELPFFEKDFFRTYMTFHGSPAAMDAVFNYLESGQGEFKPIIEDLANQLKEPAQKALES